MTLAAKNSFDPTMCPYEGSALAVAQFNPDKLLI